MLMAWVSAMMLAPFCGTKLRAAAIRIAAEASRSSASATQRPTIGRDPLSIFVGSGEAEILGGPQIGVGVILGGFLKVLEMQIEASARYADGSRPFGA
jgi:hypothetical protein